MKLRTISINNFRGIKQLSKLEVSDLNTFVGKNDSGKSTILHALNCFFNEKQFDEKDIFRGRGVKETVSIELSFEPLTSTLDDLALDQSGFITIKKEFLLEKEKGKVKANTFYLTNDFLDEEYQNLWNKKEQDLNQIIDNLGETITRSGRGNTNIQRIEQIKRIIGNEKRQNTYHVLGDFLKNIERVYNLKLPEYSLFDAEQDLDVEANNFQSQFKPIISSYFEKIVTQTNDLENDLIEDLALEFEEIRKFMIKNVPGLKSLKPTTEFDWVKSLKKFDLNLHFESEDYAIPISHKGTGFKRLLMVAYFEYLSSKREISNQIFAIEEPETYLHPSAQESLLNSIIELSKKSQFFITTHSPVFAGATNGKDSILVTKSERGFSEYSKEGGIIDRIISELGIKPDYSLISRFKFLIFVEGEDDVHFYKIASQNLLGKKIENDGILCVIGGGASLKNYADLDLFKKLTDRGDLYAVCVDGDDKNNGKEKWQKRLEEKCREDGAIFMRLPKREIENYCHKNAISRCCRDIKIENISIEDDTDVSKHLKELGLKVNFKKGTNIEVLGCMTKSEWLGMDKEDCLKNFFEQVYRRIS